MAELTATASDPPTLGTACQEDVTVLEVGPDRKKYYIHKALLTYHSEYFRAALQGPWKEAEENMIKLDDVEPFVVNLFVHWLYGNTFPEPGEVNETYRIIGHDYINDLVAKVRAYAFADRFLVPEFRRVMHNSLVDHVHKSTSYIELPEILEVSQAAFSDIPLDRPFLQLLVNYHCELWDQCCHDDADSVNELPRRFLVRSMRRLHEKWCKEKEGIVEEELCYYEHPSNEEQNACLYVHMKYDAKKDYGFFGKRLCYLCDIGGFKAQIPR